MGKKKTTSFILWLLSDLIFFFKSLLFFTLFLVRELSNAQNKLNAILTARCIIGN